VVLSRVPIAPIAENAVHGERESSGRAGRTRESCAERFEAVVLVVAVVVVVVAATATATAGRAIRLRVPSRRSGRPSCDVGLGVLLGSEPDRQIRRLSLASGVRSLGAPARNLLTQIPLRVSAISVMVVMFS